MDFSKLEPTAVLLEKYKTPKNRPHSSELYHALAYISKQPLVYEGKKVSATKTLASWDLEDTNLLGAMRLLTLSPRSRLLRGPASASENLRFSALVPLVLSAYKQYSNVNYSQWNWLDPQLKHFLDADTWTLQPYIANPKLLELEGLDLAQLTSQLGVSPPSCWSPRVPSLQHLPRLAKVVVLQTWVAYPTLRSPYMILDFNNLDNQPKSLYGDLELFEPETTTTPSTNNLWN